MALEDGRLIIAVSLIPAGSDLSVVIVKPTLTLEMLVVSVAFTRPIGLDVLVGYVLPALLLRLEVLLLLMLILKLTLTLPASSVVLCKGRATSHR
jgi:hypothetical protein